MSCTATTKIEDPAMLIVRTGNPVFRKRGLEDRFADLTRTPEESANFDAAMADFTALAALAVREPL